jgi:hypothetical protein
MAAYQRQGTETEHLPTAAATPLPLVLDQFVTGHP